MTARLSGPTPSPLPVPLEPSRLALLGLLPAIFCAHLPVLLALISTLDLLFLACGFHALSAFAFAQLTCSICSRVSFASTCHCPLPLASATASSGLRPLTAFTGTRCLPFLCCSLSPMHALAHCLLSPMLCLLSALISCSSLCFLSPTHSPSAHPQLCLHSLPALAYGRPLCLVSPTRALAVCSLAYARAQCPLSPIPAVRSLIWLYLCPLLGVPSYLHAPLVLLRIMTM